MRDELTESPFIWPVRAATVSHLSYVKEGFVVFKSCTTFILP